MISVIIPTYNEERALPATLACLERQRRPFETIVADGGSRDATIDVANDRPVDAPRIRVVRAPKGRASQMNAGAAAATGDWLLFLHADTLLPEDALESVAALPAHVTAGGFRHRFSGEGWQLGLVSLMDNIRCRTTRIIYGDQAMFVRRKHFEHLGGFPPCACLEDVYFCERLVQTTRPVVLPSPVITDSRKFVQMGIWRSVWRAARIILSVELGRPIPPDGLRFFEDVR